MIVEEKALLIRHKQMLIKLLCATVAGLERGNINRNNLPTVYQNKNNYKKQKTSAR